MQPSQLKQWNWFTQMSDVKALIYQLQFYSKLYYQAQLLSPHLKWVISSSTNSCKVEPQHHWCRERLNKFELVSLGNGHSVIQEDKIQILIQFLPQLNDRVKILPTNRFHQLLYQSSLELHLRQPLLRSILYPNYFQLLHHALQCKHSQDWRDYYT